MRKTSVATDRSGDVDADTETSLFRQEALEEHRQGQSRLGDLIRISPSWIGWVQVLLVAVLISAVLFVVLGRVDQFAEGPAIVKVDGHIDVTTNADGVVVSVATILGRHVSKGDPLLRLYDGIEAMELERVNRELDTYVVSWLRNPFDPMTRQSLGLVRARQEYAASRLQERIVRAPRAGIVSDIRVLPGQRVAPGETVLGLLMKKNRIGIIAMLPGNERPQLQVGMTLQLELAGYRGSSREMTIESIGNELIGPAAVRRYLGPEIADVVLITGPVVIVEASIPSPTFESEGATYEYHDGMQGFARVRIRSERILSALFPALKSAR